MAMKEFLQPGGMFDASAYGYTQVVVAPPGRQLFIAGQVGWDASGRVVSEDFEEQVKQALVNLDLALKGGGATRGDITLVRLYVPNHDRAKNGPLARQLAAFFEGLTPPAQTLLGIQALALPELLVEIEASVVIAE